MRDPLGGGGGRGRGEVIFDCLNCFNSPDVATPAIMVDAEQKNLKV